MVFRADYDGTFGQKGKIRYSWDPICAANCVTGIGNQFDTRMMLRHWVEKEEVRRGSRKRIIFLDKCKE